MDVRPTPDPNPVEPLSSSARAFRLRSLFPTPLLTAPVKDAPALNIPLREAILARAAGSEDVKPRTGTMLVPLPGSSMPCGTTAGSGRASPWPSTSPSRMAKGRS